jgi:hypothetical protein
VISQRIANLTFACGFEGDCAPPSSATRYTVVTEPNSLNCYNATYRASRVSSLSSEGTGPGRPWSGGSGFDGGETVAVKPLSPPLLTLREGVNVLFA